MKILSPLQLNYRFYSNESIIIFLSYFLPTIHQVLNELVEIKAVTVLLGLDLIQKCIEQLMFIFLQPYIFLLKYVLPQGTICEYRNVIHMLF